MNKFEKGISLSGNDVLKKRSALLSKQAQQEAEAHLNNLKRDLSDLEMKLEMLSDLSPSSSDSLVLANGNFDAKKWVSEMLSITEEMETKKLELEIAQKFYNEWFGESKE